jgi:hypothetical protein
MKRYRALWRVGFVLVLAAVALACATNDLVVGDDTVAPLPSPDGAKPAPVLDGSSPPVDGSSPPVDGSPPPVDANDDGEPKVPATPCAAPATCQASTQGCKQTASGVTCPNAGDVCCTQKCPQLVPPAPTFCDGGPFAPLYDSSKCVVGYDCAPVTCTAAGGQCVASVPGACANGNVGNAAKYSCASGSGTICCLP